MLRILFFIFILAPLTGWAKLYPDDIAFQHLLENKDIALGTIFKTYQDREGFIWFGSENSLTRFDGYTLKPVYFYENEGDKERRKNVAILDIIEDKNGTLWLASSEGLLYYDSQLNRLIRAPEHPSLSSAPISKAYLRKITGLNNGMFAIASYTGLYIVEPTTGKGSVFTASSVNGIQHNSVRSLLYDGDKKLWIGTGFGLDLMHLDTENIQHFKPFSEDRDSVPHNCITSIIQTGDQNLWLGTRRGVLYFDPITERYSQHFYDEKRPSDSLNSDVWTLFEGAGGSIWIGTENGLTQFDPKTKEHTRFYHEPGRSSSLNSNVIRSILTDRDNNTWISTFPSGINYIDDNSTNITIYTDAGKDGQSLNHSSVLSIAEDRSGNLWLGTDGGGLNYFDREKNTFTYYQHDPSDDHTISSDRVLSVMLDSEQTLWGGTWGGGVFYMHLSNNKIFRLPGEKEAKLTPGVSRSKALQNDKVWSITEDQKGYLWISTIRSGLSRYDRRTKDFTHYTHENGNPKSIPSNHIWTTFEDSRGRFWVGSTGGLSILDRSTGEFKNFASDNQLQPGSFHWPALAIFEDSQQRIWVGTDTGLHLFMPDKNRFSSYGLENGFIDDSIRSITEDANGGLWLGTNGGVILFVPETLGVKNYYREDGKLIGGFNYNSSTFTRSGEIAIGGKSGLRLFRMENTNPTNTPKEVVFTNFKIFNQDVIHGLADSPLQKPISQAEMINLNYDDSFFSFEFSTLDYSNRNQIQYAYKLEGFDNQWNYVGSQRIATYTNLDPGTYQLRVKSKKSNEPWHKNYTSLNIEIHPPWWKTRFAYSIYLVMFVLAYTYFKHNQSLRNIIRDNNDSLEIKRKLNQRVTKILEDERKTISQEVHDNVNSTIVATRMMMQNIERMCRNKNMDVATVADLAKKADTQLSQAYSFFRSLLQKLRPEVIEALGFDGAIQELVENYNQIHPNCMFEFQLNGNKTKVEDEVGIGLYRVAQEGITNAIKHAFATRIGICLNYRSDHLEMTITDNGIGIDRDVKPGLGIEHMTDRVQSLNGTLKIESNKDSGSKGTTIRVSVPITHTFSSRTPIKH